MPEIYVEGLKPKTFKNNDTSEVKTKIGKITPADARLINAYSLSKKTGIIDGYGGNCSAINTTITANADNTYTITLNKGAISIYGGLATIEQGTQVKIPNSITNGSFGIKVNLSNSAGSEMKFYYKSQSEALIKNNLQDDEVGGIYEFELYKYSISGSIMTLTTGADLNTKIKSNQYEFENVFEEINDYVIEQQRLTGGGWYRKWKSGFKEIGFNINPSSANLSLSVSFPDNFEFSDANYILSVKNATATVSEGGAGSSYDIARYTGAVQSRTKTGFVMSCRVDTYMVYACGY